MMTHHDNGTTLRARFCDLAIHLDEHSGLPLSVLFEHNGQAIELPFAWTVTLITDGREMAREPFGMTYVDTTQLVTAQRSAVPIRHRLNGSDETYTVTTVFDHWEIEWHYTFRPQHPRLETSFTIRSTTDEPACLRDVHIEIALALPDFAAWLVEAPGNHLRPGVAADALTQPVTVSSVGQVAGSTGLIALHHPDRGHLVALWPFSKTEIGDVQLVSRDTAIVCTIKTGLAGRFHGETAVHYGTVQVDAFADTWEATRDAFPAWYAPLGLTTPGDRSPWIEVASIFEVQIGTSVFHGGYEYSPYPTVKDLLADLGRIKGLGFDVIQVMPRHPYPSYNVHDYADITTSYGNEDDLRTLVAACHALGMRVIFDILLHGVIDQDVMARTVARIRSGPFAARLDEQTASTLDFQPGGEDDYLIAWCRHILDFEPYWMGGSPPHHPLVDQHPEWFMRDADQQIIGMYTKAFDVANPAWQDYFSRSCEDIVRRLDIDGFRFDAPTYNDLPNWSTATEGRASYSALGCLTLFEQLRTRLKHLKPELILYTEPSGVLFRQAMDITYNYDEQWLVSAVLEPSTTSVVQRTGIRNGRDLAAWFRERNAVLPMGSLITHHIDSHDTFWWPLPGQKWKREQFGLAATRAVLAVYALSGGAYMTFIGGEDGIEADLRRVHRLRASISELGRGRACYDAVVVDHDAVYAVVRQHGSACSVVLVNLSDQPIATTCRLETTMLGLDMARYTIQDAWNDEAIAENLDYAWSPSALGMLPLQLNGFGVRVLVIRPMDRTT